MIAAVQLFCIGRRTGSSSQIKESEEKHKEKEKESFRFVNLICINMNKFFKEDMIIEQINLCYEQMDGMDG